MKALAERAVKAARLYHGSMRMSVRDAQRLYTRMNSAIQSLTTKTGIDPLSVHEQVTREAQRRGALSPLPGKDY